MKNDKKENKISGYFKAEIKVLAIVLVSGLIFNIGVVLPPIFQGKLLDSVILGLPSKIVLQNGAIFLGAVIIVQSARYFKRFYVRRFANNLSYKLRMIMYNNLVNMQIDVVESQSESELMTRCVGDVEIFVEGTRKCLTETFDSGVLMISYFVSLLIYDYKTTLLAVAFIPISFLIAYMFKKSIVKANIKARSQNVVANEYTSDLISNATLYRNSDALEQKSIECEATLQDLKVKNLKASVFENAMQPIYMIICSLGVVFIIYFGVQNVTLGKFTIGDFTAYLTMFLALTIKSSRIGKLFNAFQKAKVSWDRIKDRLIEIKPQKNEAPQINDTKLEVDGLKFEVDGKNIFENVSFKASAGEIIGVTGRVSSGKSALGVCLLGIYDYCGSVKLNGKEVCDYSKFEKSQLISYQTHDSFLFSDTIENNITFGENSDLSKLLQIVSVDKDVSNMTDGIKTMIGDGGIRLSGGQKQRVALARALNHNKKLIILDDPVSAVDVDTEKTIVNNLRQNFKDSVIIFISHRLTSFESFDKVLFLDNNGCLFGTHSEIMAQSKLYNSIFKMQGRLAND